MIICNEFIQKIDSLFRLGELLNSVSVNEIVHSHNALLRRNIWNSIFVPYPINGHLFVINFCVQFFLFSVIISCCTFIGEETTETCRHRMNRDIFYFFSLFQLLCISHQLRINHINVGYIWTLKVSCLGNSLFAI